ncbi:hypothetical protein B0F90DRAFT_1727523 [Multifurca ochricompacta]|uniref:Uncharacterized protein n=1 Tax=Multifurca ochricompacta TaxID=376703 RepID=A0AAD4QMV4_9AGAM|nr:hypothetical protein B0F90DRAFT_1727523 [Multifurca ochricompacta]
MRLFSIALVLLTLTGVHAQFPPHGDIWACLEVHTGEEATPTLVKNGLPPPNDPELLVGYFCEPLAPGIPCYKPFPSGISCFRTYCLCCGNEGIIEDFTGYVGIDCIRVLNQTSTI